MPTTKPRARILWRLLLRLGECLFAVALATLLRLALAPVVGSAVPFVTYFTASVILAWYRGFWPAAVTILISATVGWEFVLRRGDAVVSLWGRGEQAAVFGFAIASLAVAFLIDYQRRTVIRMKAAEQAQGAASRENLSLLAQSQQAKRELTHTNEELRRAIQDLEVFAYSASHDLREPLRTIVTFTQMIQRTTGRAIEENNPGLLDTIIAAARRMNTLIDDLLLYTTATRMEPGPIPDVNSSDVVEEVIEALSSQMNDVEASVTVEPLPAVAMHRSSLARVFQNLISNSLKYRSDQPPRIYIAGRPEAEWCVFEVTDNGLGIEPQYGKQIFGLFKRLHGHEYPGSGIGLAICQRLVEQYGGRIWLEKSEPGTGSTFCFSVRSAGPSPGQIPATGI